MEFDAYIKQRKKLYSLILNLIEIPDNFDDEYQSLIEEIEKQEILKDKAQTIEIFYLLLSIADNHYRTTNFFFKD